jgi:DNA-binding NarL/FixJ family response regulator
LVFLTLKAEADLEMSKVRVLVVDDHEAFRRFICSTLENKPELEIVAEAADGLEAVQKAEELQPDLIVLDIGLPGLNGIEAARRIRKISANSKIIFVSLESSTDVVQEALDLGASGYVAKAQAGNELLAAVGEVLGGRRFLSSGLSGHHLAGAADSHAIDSPSRNEPLPSLEPLELRCTRKHEVEFYSDDAAFVTGFAYFIEGALKAGRSVVVAATESHRESILHRLQELDVDIVASMEQGRYLALDAGEMLSAFMGNDLPDAPRFFKTVGDLIAVGARGTAGDHSRVSICGECAPMLWAQGKTDAAIQVEQLCSQVIKRYGIDMLCGFSLNSFYREEDKMVFQKIQAECEP